MQEKTPQQKFNEEFLAFQQETIFDGQLPENFSDLVKDSFMFTSPAYLKMPVDQWVTLLEKTGNYTVLDMGTILHVMEQRTAREIEISMEDYNDRQKMLYIITMHFKSIVEPKATAIKRKVETLDKIANPVQPNQKKKQVIPLGQA